MSDGIALSNDKALLVTGWMKPKLRGVQRLALEIQIVQATRDALVRPAIDRIAEQRMADRGHMDAHLVGPPGFQPAFDQRGVAAAASSVR